MTEPAIGSELDTEYRAHDLAEGNQLRHDLDHRIDGYGKPDARTAPARRIDGGIHTDQLSEGIEQRPA